jgi:A/G-specific adenine glycosylase
MCSIDDLDEPILAWFHAHSRPLPWRISPTPWGVLVSEVMLQQTPVKRVDPVWRAWMERWPTPDALAAEPAAAAIKAWGRLGYPRRALRLHATAVIITNELNGEVPHEYDELRTLPGIGDYTAAAVVSFAYGGRAVVLDVNVRRLLARLLDGQAAPAGHVTATERARAADLVPDRDPPGWAAATMELGQVVCTARDPRCEQCPVADACLWRARSYPDAHARTTRPQGFVGTDRQVRGLIVERLRSGGAVRSDIDVLWPDAIQLARALDSLVQDGLVDPIAPGRYALPGDT